MIQVTVVGATGLIGQAVLDLLAERQFPAARVYAVDLEDKAGETVSFGNLELDVHTIDDFAFENVGLAIFAAGSVVSKEYIPGLRSAGCTVIDFSPAYRLEQDVPLVVPAVNAELLKDSHVGDLITAPNCTVTPLAIALQPLRKLGIARLTVSTYQSVSGSGQAAMEELANQTTSLFAQKETEVSVYSKRIAFNVLPQIGELDDEGIAEEERSIMQELAKLFGEEVLNVEATCVRVPVFFGHSWSVTVEFQNETSKEELSTLLVAAGLQVVKNHELGYVTPMEATGNDGIWISRLRKTGSSWSFWVAADNVRVGAALNCVKIAEALQKQGLFV